MPVAAAWGVALVVLGAAVLGAGGAAVAARASVGGPVGIVAHGPAVASVLAVEASVDRAPTPAPTSWPVLVGLFVAIAGAAAARRRAPVAADSLPPVRADRAHSSSTRGPPVTA